MHSIESEIEGENRLEAPRIVTTPPGPKSKAILDSQMKVESQWGFSSPRWPIVVESAVGSAVRDVDGNCYIDWVSGGTSLSLGHRNSHVKMAINAQEELIWNSLGSATETRL